MKRLFRVLSQESIMLTFKNLLLGRGLYLLGRNPRTAFDIIESLTGLLYPLKWEHPKILSYESRYEIFESPVPLIYYFNSDKLDYDKLRTLDLSEKCLLFVDSNAVQEYCANPGLKELPPKLLASLEKDLNKIVGNYSGSYSAKKATLTSDHFDALLEDYKDLDSVSLECWKVRECFFDFMRDLLDGYQECYKESTLLFERGSLDSETIFDFPKFVKQKSGLKNSSFVHSFVKTSLLSRFIECRIHPESENQAIYYNYFDLIHKEKKENPKTESLKLFMKKGRNKFPIETPYPVSAGIDQKTVTGYQGVMPLLDQSLFVPSRITDGNSHGLVVEDDFDLDNPLVISKLADEKWARVNIEMIQTVWFLCLRVFMLTDCQDAYASLAVFAYDKIIELEVDRVYPSLDCLKSIAFLLGTFGEGSKLQRIIRKFSKKIEEKGQLASIYSEFTKGVLHSKKLVSGPGSLTLAISDISVSPTEHSQPKPQPPKAGLMEQGKDDPSDLIPVAIKCEFSTNVHCPTCGTIIPLEIILAKMSKRLGVNKAICPNQACLCEYEPSFNCVFLKQLPPSMKTQESVKLMSPLNLLFKTKEFLEENDPPSLMDVASRNAASLFRPPVLERPFLPEPLQPALFLFPAAKRPEDDAPGLLDLEPVRVRREARQGLVRHHPLEDDVEDHLEK